MIRAFRLGAEELLELGRAPARAVDRAPFFARRTLGQAADDPLVVARVQMGQSFADAIGAISKVLQVDPKTMVLTPEAARKGVERLIGSSPAFTDYVLKTLVVASVIIKDKIRALGFEPQEVANFLEGAAGAIGAVIPENELPGRLRAAEEDIIRKAPEGIREKVKALIEGSGISPENLAPNLPEGTTRTGLPSWKDLAAWQKIALLAVPVVGAAAVAFARK